MRPCVSTYAWEEGQTAPSSCAPLGAPLPHLRLPLVVTCPVHPPPRYTTMGHSNRDAQTASTTHLLPCPHLVHAPSRWYAPLLFVRPPFLLPPYPLLPCVHRTGGNRAPLFPPDPQFLCA